MPRVYPSLVFNELCVQKPAPSRAVMLDWINGLVGILTTAFDRGVRSFRTDRNFRNLMLLEDGYTVQRWCEDVGYDVDQVAQDFLLTFFERESYIRPPLADLDETHSAKQRIAKGFAGGYEGKEALGLGYAYLLGHTGVSFCSEDCWNKDFVLLERLEETEAEYIEEQVQVKHVSVREHLDVHHPARIYDRNPKHPQSADEKAYISIMDLSHEDAQQALLDGIRPDGMDEFYSIFNGYFYIFRPHRESVGQYHGYRLDKLPPADKATVLKAMRDEGMIEDADYNRYIKQ